MSQSSNATNSISESSTNSASSSLSETASSTSSPSQSQSLSQSQSESLSSSTSTSTSISTSISPSITISPSMSPSITISASISPAIINYTIPSPSAHSLAPTEVSYSLNIAGIATLSTLGFILLVSLISSLLYFLRRRNENRFKRRVSKKPITVISSPIQYTQPRVTSNTKVVYLSDTAY